jgi:hypothetical protein
LRRLGVDAAFGDDGLVVFYFGFVAVHVLQIIVVAVHVFDVEAFEIGGPTTRARFRE